MTFTTLGTNAGVISTGADLQLTVPVGGIPAGSFIFFSASWNANVVGFSGADSVGNTYNAVQLQGGGGTLAGTIEAFYAYNVSALSAGQHIWVHNASGSNHSVRITGFFSDTDVYSAGDPYDASASSSAVAATAQVMSVPFSGTAGTPAFANSLFVGSVYWTDTGAIIQDARYTFPPDKVTALGTASMEGGHTTSSTAINYVCNHVSPVHYIGNLLVFRPAVVAPVYTPIRRRGPRFVDRIIRI